MLAKIAAVLAVTAIAAGLIGNSGITAGLKHNALMNSALWARSAERLGLTGENGGPAPDVQGLSDLMNATSADAVVLLDERGPIRALAPGAADGTRRFKVDVPEWKSRDPSTQAYSAGHLSPFFTSDFRTWVVLPELQASNGRRVAIRIDQSDEASSLVHFYERQILYLLSVAAITFCSFMAGYTYRSRKLALEDMHIRHLATHDGLTGLPNRKQFLEHLQEAVALSNQGGTKTALFLLDLDGFKAVNDTLGHPIGDELLRAASQRLKQSLRAQDMLARLSGDEFAIVLSDVTAFGVLPPFAERVLQLLHTPFRIQGHDVTVGCSIGLAVAPDNADDSEKLIRNADFALYRAKSEGRGSWRFFDPKMEEDLASRRMLEDGLRHALENDLFQVLYQPQIDLASGRAVGYEAMLRWALPGKGLIPAGVFVSLAEETGLVVPIGEWVIRQVARDAARLPRDRRIAINISATQLRRENIERVLMQTLADEKLESSRIEIEVNEGVLGRDEEMIFARLMRLREKGFTIVMDSFGVGAMSLGLLARFTFDKVKIDRALIWDTGAGKNAHAVLTAICDVCRSLGVRVAGQGVETYEHTQVLRSVGCAEAQGFYFAPPMTIDEILQQEDGQLQAIA
ncbi:diguanylate cyclase (GGDEF) domain-containing protein [Faunimonas pinastri]|uniref:Diguanylate cyclase (GGDEF) domain-containing protein n=1 Tax=Faunimonas pinastri TaxID=1855383 RepID=A0A1H9GM91_9HYPH|nr:EAL domain-containing protein [Faunimonas pinastri]SEQ51205.1 diguanylate cyclase (GGDEF) domain-containing protein [Faunimonas pinastri]